MERRQRRDSQLASNSLFEEDAMACPHSKKTGGDGQFLCWLLHLDPVVVFWEEKESWLTVLQKLPRSLQLVSGQLPRPECSCLHYGYWQRDSQPVRTVHSWRGWQCPQRWWLAWIRSQPWQVSKLHFRGNSLILATVPVSHLPPDLSSPSPFPAKALGRQHAILCRVPEGGFSKVEV